MSDSLEAQAGNLLRIAEIVTLQSTDGETAATNELSFATEDLIMYLNNHIYTSAPFIGYGTPYGSGFGSNSEDSTKNDMVAQVKAEIRSVKGAVLNMYPQHSNDGQTKGWSLTLRVVETSRLPLLGSGLVEGDEGIRTDG